MEHPRVCIEGKGKQRSDVVLKGAHAGNDPVRAADVIDEVEIAERSHAGHDPKYARRR